MYAGQQTRHATLALVAALSLAGCATTSTSSKADQRKEELAAKIWDEKSPYGFHRAVAKTMLRTRQPRRAVRHIQRLLAMKPETPEPHFLMAQAHLALGIHTPALEELRRAITFEDHYAPAHALLGVLLDQEGQSKQAEKHHRKSIKISPMHAGFRNNLGFNLYLQGKDRAAVRAFHKALALDPSIRKAHNNLGFAYGRLGKMDEAYKHFKLAGRQAEADNNMGFAYERRGQLERAYEHYLRAAKRTPKAKPIRQNLARICKRLGRPMPELLPSSERRQDSEGKGS